MSNGVNGRRARSPLTSASPQTPAPPLCLFVSSPPSPPPFSFLPFHLLPLASFLSFLVFHFPKTRRQSCSLIRYSHTHSHTDGWGDGKGGREGGEKHVDRQASELFPWLDCNQTLHHIAMCQTGARCIRKTRHARTCQTQSVSRCVFRWGTAVLRTRTHPHIQAHVALNS